MPRRSYHEHSDRSYHERVANELNERLVRIDPHAALAADAENSARIRREELAHRTRWSPIFPTQAEAARRLRQYRAAVIARCFLAAVMLGGVLVFVPGPVWVLGLSMFIGGGAGFVATCIISARATEREPVKRRSF